MVSLGSVSSLRKLGALGANVGIVSRKEENLVLALNEFMGSDYIDVAWYTGDARDPDGINKSFE